MVRKKIFFIAEIGINHNGDINIAKQLIDNAKEAGFDAVKFQKRTIDLVYSSEQLETLRESPWGTKTRQQKEGLEFGKKEYDEINKYCLEKKIEWFASAWDLKSLDFLDQYNLKYQKIASAMIIDELFLKNVAKRKKYTFISTGMSEEKHIQNAVKIFNEHSCPFELMHCISTYPMKTEDANLETIGFLRKKFNCKVGYSGHESGLAVSYAAVGYEISSLERHVTLDRSMYGSDQSASLEPRGQKELLSVINKMLISSGKNMFGKITKEEIKIAEKLRAHLPLKK
jgi:N-acetylneuraminate synthase